MNDIKKVLLSSSWKDNLGNTMVFTEKGVPSLGIVPQKEGCILLCIDGSCCCEDTYTEVCADKEEIISALKAMGYEKMADVFEKSFK